MPSNLHDLHILVTRPKPQGEELCAKIAELGGRPIYFPTIEIKPISNPDWLRQHMSSLAEYDWMIFISPQAVLHTAALIQQYWPTLPKKIALAAMGEGTKNALEAAGFTNIIYPQDEWNSEGLLNLASFKTITDKKIMLVRGAGGRELLGDTLLARGALVTHWIAYERILPHNHSKLDIDQIDIMICTSGESLRNLIKLLNNTDETEKSVLFTIPLIVISPRLVELAHELGFKKVLMSANASHNALIETIKGIGYVRK